MTKAQKEKRNRKLAEEIREFLFKWGMWIDTTIYFNGKAFSPIEKDENGKMKFYYNDREHLIEYEDDPSRYVEWYNKDGITMTFEGDFYEVMNYAFESRFLTNIYEEFEELLRKHNARHELGHAWSMCIYFN